MHFETAGNENAPLLICVPGLLGGAEDFRLMIDAWKDHFFIIIPDPNAARRSQGLNLTSETMQNVSFDYSALEIGNVLKEYAADKPCYFVGISLGGKIVYDFAARFPELFFGGVVTDVGPGPFEDSDHFKHVFKLVTDTNLDLPWPELRQDLRSRIQDKNLRILIQTQLHYPTGKPPAAWKTAMQNLKSMLQKQSIDEQFSSLEKVSNRLVEEKKWITVLYAALSSGISAETFEKMQSLPFIKFKTLNDANHHMHVSHKDAIISAVLNMLAE